MKISRPPSPITRAAARAPRNAPVRFTSRISRHTDGSVSRGPARIGEIPALQIQTSTPPHSATVASATASLNVAVGHVAAAHERRSRQLVGDRLEVGLGAGHERDPRAAVRERVREQPAEPPARAGDHHPLPGHVRTTGEGRGDVDLLGHRRFPSGCASRPVFVPTSTIPASCSPTPTSSRCTGGCS